MGEWVRVTIDIGGPLPKSSVPKFLEALSQEADLEPLEGGDPNPTNLEELLELVSEETGKLELVGEGNYGLLPHLTKACVELGLSYLHWAASTCEADSQFFWWTPDFDDELACAAFESSRLRAYTTEELKYLKQGLRSRRYQSDILVAATLREVDLLLNWEPDIPKFEITDA